MSKGTILKSQYKKMAKLNQLPPVTDLNKSSVLAQQAHEDGYRQLPFSEFFNQVSKEINIVGIEMKAVAPGPLPAGPAGQNRKMEGGPGTWTYGGNSFTIPDGSIGTLWWNGSTWSLEKEVGLPKNPAEAEDWGVGSYKKGVLVYHNGKTWRSLIDNNEDEPSVGIGSWEDMTRFQNLDSDLVDITDTAVITDGVYINMDGDFIPAVDFAVFKIPVSDNGYLKFTGASYLVATALNNIFPVMWFFSDSDEIIAPLVYSNTGSSTFNIAMVRDYRSNTSDG